MLGWFVLVFLVIDREYSGSISTRKLVIETAKFNVITAYSAAEALETLEMFPRITGMGGRRRGAGHALQ